MTRWYWSDYQHCFEFKNDEPTGNYFEVSFARGIWIRLLIELKNFPLIGRYAKRIMNKMKVMHRFKIENPPDLGHSGIQVFEVKEH